MLKIEQLYNFIDLEMDSVFDNLAEKYLLQFPEIKDTKEYISGIIRIIISQGQFPEKPQLK